MIGSHTHTHTPIGFDFSHAPVDRQPESPESVLVPGVAASSSSIDNGYI